MGTSWSSPVIERRGYFLPFYIPCATLRTTFQVKLLEDSTGQNLPVWISGKNEFRTVSGYCVD